MSRRLIYFACGLTAVLACFMLAEPEAVQQPVKIGAAPEFTGVEPENWINSTPLQLSDLRGKVVLLDFWTFDCWNCYRSFPWLNGLQVALEGRDFRIIGIHTPEFEHERVRANVERKIREFGLHHPVMLDNDFRYWRAMGNRYWPAFYLIDKQGRIRSAYVGETHAGDKRARAIETAINELLEENAKSEPAGLR